MANIFLFPGQGSQKVGMGKDFFAAYETAQKRFQEANEVLGRDIMTLMFEGPEEELKDTQNTQPALFTVEAVITDLLGEKGLRPDVALGHSLGEYSALYAAGVYSFADGLRLVAKRGQLMAEAGKKTQGAMAAVIGLDKATIASVLSTVTEGVVVPANENAPDQTVISGDAAAVDSACEKLVAAGAKRAIKLPVSGAFHSPLMQPAAEQIEEFLGTITFNAARIPVISNVTAQKETDPQVLKGLLVKQLLSPVRWVESIQTLEQQGGGTCIETGPGNVLKGLVRKCSEVMNVISCGTADNLYSLTN